MPRTTPATLALRKLGIAFKLHTYVYDSSAEHIGLQAAEALDVEPNRVLKTLMVEVDGNPVCVVVPADSEVSMKKLAIRARCQGGEDDAADRMPSGSPAIMSAASVRSGRRRRCLSPSTRRR